MFKYGEVKVWKVKSVGNTHTYECMHACINACRTAVSGKPACAFVPASAALREWTQWRRQVARDNVEFWNTAAELR